MIKNYPAKYLFFISASFLLLTIASCKKDNKNTQTTVTPTTATPTKLGLYEVDTSIYKLLFMPISKIGSQAVDYDLIFDTGSGGLVIDADGILPASMITTTGFTFTGDSTVVNGITVTSQKSTISYGETNNSTKVYGNLAYAPITIGDSHGNIIIKRLPFFIYYKGVDENGNIEPKHFFDLLGVSPEYDVTFSNAAYITSPFSYFDPGTGLTKGFKMAALGTNNFSNSGTFVPGVVTLGLTQADLNSSGFVMNTLTNSFGQGYIPYIPATVTYGSRTVNTSVLFDTGTEPYSYIQDRTASTTPTLLPANTNVTIATTSGFNFTYSTSPSEYLTYIENPGASSNVSIIGLEFFLKNEYLLDYTNNRIGVKNN
jgi:hypothetical protein